MELPVEWRAVGSWSSAGAVELKIRRSWRRDVVRKATPGRRDHLDPDELGSREDADKMQ